MKILHSRFEWIYLQFIESFKYTGRNIKFKQANERDTLQIYDAIFCFGVVCVFSSAIFNFPHRILHSVGMFPQTEEFSEQEFPPTMQFMRSENSLSWVQHPIRKVCAAQRLNYVLWQINQEKCKLHSNDSHALHTSKPETNHALNSSRKRAKSIKDYVSSCRCRVFLDFSRFSRPFPAWDISAKKKHVGLITIESLPRPTKENLSALFSPDHVNTSMEKLTS